VTAHTCNSTFEFVRGELILLTQSNDSNQAGRKVAQQDDRPVINLNGKAKQFRISEKSQKKILAAAEEMNYIPNQVAINLKSGRTRTVGADYPFPEKPFLCKRCRTNQYRTAKHGLHYFHQ
jgi:hypothetical protein